MGAFSCGVPIFVWVLILRWVKAGFYITVQTTCHRKFMVYFADKKSTTGFCFVSCYCIVVDDVNK